jgi:hypothetical protein
MDQNLERFQVQCMQQLNQGKCAMRASCMMGQTPANSCSVVASDDRAEGSQAQDVQCESRLKPLDVQAYSLQLLHQQTTST